jgi:hypothetical protein
MAKAKTLKRQAKKYSWNPSARAFLKLDAQAVGEELESLFTQYGQQVPAEAVVDKARNPASAMHAGFPWDDKTAAHEHRLEVARHLLRSYRVTLVIEGGGERTHRATVARRDKAQPKRRVYSTSEYVLGDAELRAEYVKFALQDFAAARRKYAELSELAIIFAAIDEAMKQHGRRVKAVS